MLRRLFFLLALAATLRAGLARADIVVSDPPNDVDRYVDTAATHGMPDHIANATTGLFDDTATSSGSNGIDTVSTIADQNSTIGVNSMNGTGDVTASVTAGSPSWSPRADSFFDVTFQVDVAAMYSFTAAVSWLGDDAPILNGFAEVRFQDVTNSTNLLLTGRGGSMPGANTPAPITVTLSPAVVYRLTAQAIITGGGFPGSFDADADWSFTLSPIPEAGSWMLLSPVVFGAAVCAWRGRRRRQR